MSDILLVNFGGPRNLDEVAPFLKALLSDRDVIRSRLPSFLHNWLFGRIARKRAHKVAEDYQMIGGFSPIYFDTEKLAKQLSKQIQRPVFTFHRYLTATHENSLRQIGSHITVLPLFPQFCYATTGSIARLFSSIPEKHFRWIRSYATHNAYIQAFQKRIGDFLSENGLKQEETILFFSAHGIPKSFVEEGDPYEKECNQSYEQIGQAFPKTLKTLCYQSKFGRGEWLRPYTHEAAEQILTWHEGRKNVVFIPLSFTSDHIETLFEIEKLYLPIIAAKGLMAYRCPALNCEPYWVDALVEILQGADLVSNKGLIR